MLEKSYDKKKNMDMDVVSTEEVEKVEIQEGDDSVFLDDKNSKKEPKKISKKKKIIIGIVFCLIVLVVGGSLAFFQYQEKDEKDKLVDKDKENEGAKEEKSYSLMVYGVHYDGKSFMLCGEKGSYSYCYEEAFSIPVKMENAKILDTAYDNYVLYRDDKIYLYNDDTGKSLEVDVAMDAEKYTINDSEISFVRYLDRDVEGEENVYGITSIKDGKATYYSLEMEENLYAGKYDDITAVDEELIYASNAEEGKIYLLDAKQNNRKPYLSADSACGHFSKLYVKNQYFVVAEQGCIGESILSIYTSDYKMIAENVSGAFYEFDKNGHVFIGSVKENTIKEYDLNGKEVSRYTESGEVLSVHTDLYVLKRDGAIYLKEYTGEEYKLMDWKDKYYYHTMLSRYYEEDELDNEVEKDSGYYFIFEYARFEEGAGIEFYFNPVTKKVKSWELEHIGAYAKPVLYLYPKEETFVTVEFEHEEKLTTTYPKFKDKWEVQAKSNGDLYDKDGKYYYGLYWEEDSNHRVDFQEGFYVERDDAIEFLEEKLSFIGLSDRERNEFIMYWLPILEKNEKSLVYFELTTEREAFNKLEITPKPDSLLRVAIHVKKVDREVKIREQRLVPFKREGFVAVEWGGVVYN